MKKQILIILIIITSFYNANAQSKKDLFYSIKALEIKLQNLEKRVDELKIENSQLRSEIISMTNNVNNQIKNLNTTPQLQHNNNATIGTNNNSNSSQEKKSPISNTRCIATTKKGSQ